MESPLSDDPSNEHYDLNSFINGEVRSRTNLYRHSIDYSNSLESIDAPWSVDWFWQFNPWWITRRFWIAWTAEPRWIATECKLLVTSHSPDHSHFLLSSHCCRVKTLIHLLLHPLTSSLLPHHFPHNARLFYPNQRQVPLSLLNKKSLAVWNCNRMREQHQVGHDAWRSSLSSTRSHPLHRRILQFLPHQNRSLCRKSQWSDCHLRPPLLHRSPSLKQVCQNDLLSVDAMPRHCRSRFRDAK